MARRRDQAPAAPLAGRAFTESEVNQIRDLIERWDDQHGHPRPLAASLEAIHAAASRVRRFKVWELDRVSDVERALAEELPQ